jgi:hypothetical protein
MADFTKKGPEGKQQGGGAEAGDGDQERIKMLMMRRLQKLRRAAQQGMLPHSAAAQVENATEANASAVLASVDPEFIAKLGSGAPEAVEMPMPLRETDHGGSSSSSGGGRSASETHMPHVLRESGGHDHSLSSSG